MNQIPMNQILIRGGHLVDPAAGIDAPRDVLLADGKVAAVEAPGKIKANGAEIIDGKGLGSCARARRYPRSSA